MYVDSNGSVTTGTTSSSSSSSTSGSSSTLDKNAFLQLLCTEMKYQDPLSPMDNTEYISQMATFSSLEQMQNLNTTVTSLADSLSSALSSIYFQQAVNNVGKTATYLDSSNKTVSGTIDSVVMSSGSLYYVIDGVQVSADSITALGAQKEESEILEALEDILDQLKDMQTVSG